VHHNDGEDYYEEHKRLQSGNQAVAQPPPRKETHKKQKERDVQLDNLIYMLLNPYINIKRKQNDNITHSNRTYEKRNKKNTKNSIRQDLTPFYSLV